MTAQLADVFETMRRLRMDLTNAQGKLSEVMRALAAPNFEDTIQPLTDIERIKRQISNGVLRDDIDLDAELRTCPADVLTDRQVDDLRAALAAHPKAERGR